MLETIRGCIKSYYINSYGLAESVSQIETATDYINRHQEEFYTYAKDVELWCDFEDLDYIVRDLIGSFIALECKDCRKDFSFSDMLDEIYCELEHELEEASKESYEEHQEYNRITGCAG